MNLLKPLFRISSIIMLSRILGFVRDTMIARAFGVSIITDSFFIAFKLSNLLRRIFAEGVFHQIFLPILSEYKCYNTKSEIKIFISRTLGLLILSLIVIIIIGLLTAPWIIKIIVPGFSNISEKFFITVVMFRIMFPYILFISLASLMGSILNTWNIFLAPAVTSIFLNMSMISFMLLSSYLYCCPSIIGLAWSVIIGGLLQCIYHLPFLQKIDLLVIPKINFNDKRIRDMCKSMRFALLAISGNQMSLIVNTILSSFLVSGSISWMYYADRIVELPIGVFGVTLTTILLPCLSHFVAKKNDVEYAKLINWGIKLCCLLSFPSAVILGILSKPLIIALFQYGKFLEFDVLMTQYSVIAYSVGLPGLLLIKVLSTGFYARHNIQTPIQIITITIIFTQALNLICINSLKHVVFAFSVSLGAWLNVGLLYWQFKKKYTFQFQQGWSVFCYQLIIAIFVMCIVFYIYLIILTPNWIQGNMWYRLLKVISILFVGISSYCITLWCLGLRLKDFYFLSKDIN